MVKFRNKRAGMWQQENQTKLCQHARRRNLRYYNVSRDKTPHFFRALAASCVFYYRTEHSQGFSVCQLECSEILQNLLECSMGLFLSMLLKPNALFSLLYSLLRFVDIDLKLVY